MNKPSRHIVASILIVISLLSVGIYILLPIQAVPSDPAAWANPVACTGHTAAGDKLPQIVTIPEILGSGYPNQSLAGSSYQVNSTAGGVPDKRMLTPPCSAINMSGENITTYVEIDSVWISGYYVQTPEDCQTQTINGTLCDAVGNIFDPTRTHSCYHAACVHVEIDQKWIAASQCSMIYCDQTSLAKYACGEPTTGCSVGQQSSCFTNNPEGGACLDFQGYVFWDSEEPVSHWELHPLSAWRLHPHPVSLLTEWING